MGKHLPFLIGVCTFFDISTCTEVYTWGGRDSIIYLVLFFLQTMLIKIPG